MNEEKPRFVWHKQRSKWIAGGFHWELFDTTIPCEQTPPRPQFLCVVEWSPGSKRLTYWRPEGDTTPELGEFVEITHPYTDTKTVKKVAPVLYMLERNQGS